MLFDIVDLHSDGCACGKDSAVRLPT